MQESLQDVPEFSEIGGEKYGRSVFKINGIFEKKWHFLRETQVSRTAVRLIAVNFQVLKNAPSQKYPNSLNTISALTEIHFRILLNRKEYDCSDSFPFDYEPILNGGPFGS